MLHSFEDVTVHCLEYFFIDHRYVSVVFIVCYIMLYIIVMLSLGNCSCGTAEEAKLIQKLLGLRTKLFSSAKQKGKLKTRKTILKRNGCSYQLDKPIRLLFYCLLLLLLLCLLVSLFLAIYNVRRFILT